MQNRFVETFNITLCASICERAGHPFAGIALSMMAAEARPEVIETMGLRVRALADSIAERMGWSSSPQH